MDSKLDNGFIDDLSLSSDLSTLEKDVNTIIEAESVTGLRLIPRKCEIIMDDFNFADTDIDLDRLKAASTPHS